MHGVGFATISSLIAGSKQALSVHDRLRLDSFMIGLQILASGSAANCSVVGDVNSSLLIDIGLGVSEMQNRSLEASQLKLAGQEWCPIVVPCRPCGPDFSQHKRLGVFIESGVGEFFPRWHSLSPYPVMDFYPHQGKPRCRTNIWLSYRA